MVSTDYFHTTAAACATIFGLMVNAFNARREEWATSHVRALAAGSALLELLIAMLVSFSFFMPTSSERYVPSLAALLGLAATAWWWIYCARFRETLGDDTPFADGQSRLNSLSLLAYGTLLGASLGRWPEGAAWVILWLLLSGSFEAVIQLVPSRLFRLTPPDTDVPNEDSATAARLGK